MTLSISEGSVEPVEAGVSRRRILQGVAWATPAVLIAAAAPAAAASLPIGDASVPVPLPSGTGLESSFSQSTYNNKYWNATLGYDISASTIGLYIQNKGEGAPLTGSIILTVILPVGNSNSPAWGIGNVNGIPSGEPWTLASGPTVANNKATLTLVYTGAPLGAWGGVSLSNLWVEARGNQKNQVATVSINATYQGNFTSTHTATATLGG